MTFLFEPLLCICVIWQHTFYLSPKLRAMVHMQQMAQLVNYHTINYCTGCHHQLPVKLHFTPMIAATPAGSVRFNVNLFRPSTH